MKRLLALLLFSSPAFAAQPVISPPAAFGGGLNQVTSESDINEAETPDSNNMVNTLTGAAEKRRGSKLFISQAYSTCPVTSLYRAYGSTTSGVVQKVLFATSRDALLISTGSIPPYWTVISSNLYRNAHWNFVTMQNKVIGGDDSLQNPIKQYDIMTASTTNLFQSFTVSDTVRLNAKFLLNSQDQLLLANVALASTPVNLTPSTTYYDSRLYYSLQYFSSSFTYNRYLPFDEDDGEEITGVSEKDRVIHVWKPSKIFEVDVGDYGSLNPLNLGGTYSIFTVVKGFGLFAPRSLASTGDVYIFCDASGVRFWDGAKKTRLEVEQESRIVSDKLQPLINRCIEAGTWKDAVGKYYPGRGWYLLSLEDPARAPKGKRNTVMVLDLATLSWFRFTNWDVEAWESWDGSGDMGELQYGSSTDGYVYFADDEASANDARRELPLNSMDQVSDWLGGNQDTLNVKEGTASIRLTANTEFMHSTITWMSVVNLGEWFDKKKVDKGDKLSFKVFGTSVQFIQSLRVDLQVEDISGNFNTNFTSVTLSSGIFNVANGTWTTVEIALSSFPIRASWTDMEVEDIPFADTLTFFGVRFAATGTAGFNLYFDDLRLVDNTERPLSAYRWTKQFNFGTALNKEFKEIYLNLDLPAEGTLYIDVYKDFGSFVDRISELPQFGNELFIGSYRGLPNITKIDSITFDEVTSSQAGAPSAFSVDSIATDEDFIYCGDQYNNRILKIDKSSFTAFTSYGSLGSGSTNFNFIGQISMDAENLYIADILNERIKVHRKSDLAFVQSFGQLGLNTTSFHLPTGVAVDGDGGNLYVANDGGPFNIQKLDKNTGEFKLSAQIDLDTYGEPSLAVDDKYLYAAYRSFSPDVKYLELVLEKRDKGSLEILNKIVVRPSSGALTVSQSTFSFEGDISLSRDYIYMVFTDDANQNGMWYLQKRLKSDFSLVKELPSRTRIGTVSFNETAYKPSRKTLKEPLSSEGAYIQIKFSEGDALDNPLKLYNQAYKVVQEDIR